MPVFSKELKPDHFGILSEPLLRFEAFNPARFLTRQTLLLIFFIPRVLERALIVCAIINHSFRTQA